MPMPAFDAIRAKVDSAVAARRAKYQSHNYTYTGVLPYSDKFEFRMVNGVNTLVSKYTKETMELMDAMKYHVADIQSAAAKFQKSPTDSNREQVELAVELFESTLYLHSGKVENATPVESNNDVAAVSEELTCAYTTGTIVHSDGDDCTTLDESDIVEVEGPDYDALGDDSECYSG